MDEISKIKSLREATGLSFNEIKKALTEAGGDEAKAMDVLKAMSGALAEKKSSREVKEGIIGTYLHSNKRVGSMVEVMCETDFVAKNADFQELAHDLAMHLVAMKPADEAEFLAQPFVKDPSITIEALIHQYVAKLGENIKLGRFQVFEV